MGRKITISTGTLIVPAELNDSTTAAALWEALPITARASTWGDEIYFGIPVRAAEENGRATVEMGDLGYWPPGNAFCIFFGPTPASRNANEIRPASPVNLLGQIEGDATVFKRVYSGQSITIERAE